MATDSTVQLIVHSVVADGELAGFLETDVAALCADTATHDGALHYSCHHDGNKIVWFEQYASVADVVHHINVSMAPHMAMLVAKCAPTMVELIVGDAADLEGDEIKTLVGQWGMRTFVRGACVNHLAASSGNHDNDFIARLLAVVHPGQEEAARDFTERAAAAYDTVPGFRYAQWAWAGPPGAPGSNICLYAGRCDSAEAALAGLEAAKEVLAEFPATFYTVSCECLGPEAGHELAAEAEKAWGAVPHTQVNCAARS